MRLQLVILATAMMGLMMLGAMSARAAIHPTDVVGRWGAQPGCAGGADFAYALQNGNIQRIVRDGPREQRTPVRVEVKDGFVTFHLDDKIYTFRLPSKNRLQALKYTDSRTGLTASFAPHTRFRCS